MQITYKFSTQKNMWVWAKQMTGQVLMIADRDMFLKLSLVEIDVIRSYRVVFLWGKLLGTGPNPAQLQEQSPVDAYDPTKLIPQAEKDTVGEAAKASHGLFSMLRDRIRSRWDGSVQNRGCSPQLMGSCKRKSLINRLYCITSRFWDIPYPTFRQSSIFLSLYG